MLTLVLTGSRDSLYGATSWNANACLHGTDVASIRPFGVEQPKGT